MNDTRLVHFYVFGPAANDTLVTSCVNNVKHYLEEMYKPQKIKFQSVNWFCSPASDPEPTYVMKANLALESQYKVASYDQFLLNVNMQYWLASRHISDPAFRTDVRCSFQFVVLSPYTQTLENFLQQIQQQNLVSVPLQIIGDNLSNTFQNLKLEESIKFEYLSNVTDFSKNDWNVTVQTATTSEKSELKPLKQPINSDLLPTLYNMTAKSSTPISVEQAAVHANVSEEKVIDLVSKNNVFQYNPIQKTFTSKIWASLDKFYPTTPNFQKSLSMYGLKALRFCKSLK